jgi:hypothetical protein
MILRPGMLKTYSGQQLRLASGNRNLSGLLSPTSIKKEDDIRTIEYTNEDDELGIQEDFEDDDDVYRKMEAVAKLKRDGSNFSTLRPISGRTKVPEEFFTNFSKFTNFAELENKYEDLFDRNERTLGATFAKFGDLSYYSPVQRIGAFMQYPSKLKIEHLVEIITLIRTSILL